MDPYIYKVTEERRNGPVIFISREIAYTFPFSFAYLAGYLKEKGETVEILFKPRNDNEICETIKKVIQKKPILVAMGGLFPELEEMRKWITLFNLYGRDIPLVIGGQMVSPTPELAMKVTGANFGVIGEGEIILYQLVSSLRNNEDLTQIGGLIIRLDTDDLISTGPGEIIENLSQLPAIPFELFPEEEWVPIGQWYCCHFPQAHWYYSDRVIPVHGGRGCPFQCNFCYHHSKPRYRNIPEMLSEAKRALISYHGNVLYFGDDLVLGNPKRAAELVKELERQEIHCSYSLSTRFDILSRIDNELLLKIKNSGCRIIGLGIESGSDRILKIIGKNCTSQVIIEQLRRLKEVGIIPTVSIMVGQYSETKEDVEKSIQLMQIAVRENPNINFAFTICTPFPGSRLYQEIFNHKYLKDEMEYYQKYFGNSRIGDWNLIVNMSRMSDLEVKEMFDKINKIYQNERVKALGYRLLLFERAFQILCIVNKFLIKYLNIFKVSKKISYPIENISTKIIISLDKIRLRLRGISY